MGVEMIRPDTLPSDNTLPLKTVESEKYAEGNDSTVWKTKVESGEDIERMIALKQVKRQKFTSDEEMVKSREFFEFLKNYPGFGRFVPDTLYFKARATEKDKPQSFSLQPFIEGERIDRIRDKELYRDPEVVRELIELCDAATNILETTSKNRTHKPDFMWTPESGNLRARLGAVLSDPRYSSNIVIAKEPDNNGRRVFFVDTGMSYGERAGKLNELQGRYVVNPLHRKFFKSWKKKLQDVLSEKDRQYPK